jgi:glycosyltransferase involved in cell wall biosynthesis
MADDVVSAVIPVFNCAEFLKRSIDSALAQTHRNMEVVVVDDGSTDDSALVLASYLDSIKAVRQENAGPSEARNNGVRHASGNFLAFLDGDDLWDPRKTEIQLAALKAHPTAVAIYCDHRSIDAHDQVLGPTGALEHPRSSGRILEDLIRGQRIKSPSLVMVRRDAFEAVGGFDPVLRYSEDYDLWLKLAMRGPILYQLDTLASYRVHGGNVSLGPGRELKECVGNMHALEKLASSKAGIETATQRLARARLFATAMDLGWILRHAGDGRKAMSAYQRALALNPVSSKAWAGWLSALAASLKLPMGPK